MKRTTLLLVLIGISIQITQAQVKEQYRDQDDASTVVVVKEEGANNIEILNSQFDLDEVSMGEQIMIIMKDGKPVMVKSDGTPINVNKDDTPAEPAEDVFVGAEMPVTQTPEPVVEEVVQEATPVVQKVAQPAAKATTVSSNTSKTRAKSAPGTYPVKTKFKKKRVSRKAYKKRKGFSLFGKNGSTCYRF